MRAVVTFRCLSVVRKLFDFFVKSCCRDFNETRQEANTQHPLQSLFLVLVFRPLNPIPMVQGGPTWVQDRYLQNKSLKKSKWIQQSYICTWLYNSNFGKLPKLIFCRIANFVLFLTGYFNFLGFFYVRH